MQHLHIYLCPKRITNHFTKNANDNAIMDHIIALEQLDQINGEQDTKFTAD